MTQADFTIANQTFPNTRTELNTSLQALATNSAGNSAPSTTFASQWWFDSDGNKLYIRNKDNDAWVEIFSIGATSDKVESVGNGDLTFADNNKLLLGTGGDLEIYHDGSNSYIADTGTGDLKITSNGNAISLQKGTSETMAFFDTDGGCELYHDNAKKFETTATGVDVTGAIVTDAGGTIGATGTATTVAGIPFYSVSSNNSLYTHDVSGTDNTAENNTAYGFSAMDAITTGDHNVAIGKESLTSNTTGSSNLSIGVQANYGADTESHNLSIGQAALGSSVAGGEFNIAIGNYSLDALTSGDNNVSIGYNAGTALTTSDNNIFIGSGAGQATTTAAGNTVIGAYAIQSGVFTGANNIVIGKLAGYNMTSADANIIIGEDAGLEQTTADNNVLIGQGAGANITTGGDNIFVGTAAGDGHDAETNNLGIGKNSLGGNINGGEYNVGIGNTTLDALTSGDKNTVVGYDAGTSVTTANNSVLIGYEAGKGITTQNNNVCIGYQAGIGISQTNNVLIGVSAGISAGAAAENTGVGSSVFIHLTNGTDNVAMGESAAQNLTTGDYNTIIGSNTEPSTADAQSQNVFGFNVDGSGNGTFTFGSGSNDTACSNGGTSWSNPSDVRIKKDIETSTAGLSFINDLRPVDFKFKTKGELDSDFYLYEEGSTEPASFTDQIVNGFIAQEVKTVIDNHPEYKGDELWKEGLEKHDKRQRVAPAALIPILTKAVQELSAEINKLKGE